MNINVLKARTMLGMVSEQTSVDSMLLLEDSAFQSLITDYAHRLTVEDGADRLTEYVNANF